jgi:hypothetical protein
LTSLGGYRDTIYNDLGKSVATFMLSPQKD